MKYFKLLFIVFAMGIVTPTSAQSENERASVRFVGVVINIEDSTKVYGLTVRNLWRDRNFDDIVCRSYYRFNNSFRSITQFYESSVTKTCESYFVKLGLGLSGINYLFDYPESEKRPVYELGAVITDLFVFSHLSGAAIVKAEAQIEIEWQLFDIRTKNVVYRGKSKVQSEEVNMDIVHPGSPNIHSQPVDVRSSINVALHRSIDKLLRDSEFRQLLHKKEIDYTSYAAEDSLQIAKVNVTNEQRTALNDAVQSTVTVLSGGGHGSGFFISTDGLILTCEHVVGGKNEVEVMVSKGVILNAKVIRTNLASDVALLQIKDVESTPVALASGTQVQAGDVVYSIGTPGSVDFESSLSKGIVSGFRMLNSQELIQTDSSVSPGNSGGPLINDKGEVLGIVNAKLIGKDVEGVNFAIPIDEALDKLSIKVGN